MLLAPKFNWVFFISANLSVIFLCYNVLVFALKSFQGLRLK